VPKREQLTPEQERTFHSIRERWAQLVVGTATVTPAQTEDAITALYAAIGREKPDIFTLGSPFQLGLILEVIAGAESAEPSQFEKEAKAHLQSLYWMDASKPFTAPFRAAIEQLVNCIDQRISWKRLADLRPQVLTERRFLISERFSWSELFRTLDRELDNRFDELLQRKVLSPFHSNRWNIAQFFQVQLRDDLNPRAAEEDRVRRAALTERTRRRVENNLRGQSSSDNPRIDADLVEALTRSAPRQFPWQIQELLFFWRNAGRLALLEFCASLPEFAFEPAALRFLKTANCVHAFVRFDDVCFVSEHPTTVSLDDRERVHADNGPAIEYPDGYSVYAWHGIAISREKAHIVDQPQRITIAEIDEEANVAVRRVMIERFGAARFIKESGAQIVDQDKDPQTGHERILYRRELPADEAIVMVRVTNSSPEPDGSYKQYFIRVPPTVTTARQAIAWTFSMQADEYRPSKQT
jgi:hypothetical protein